MCFTQLNWTTLCMKLLRNLRKMKAEYIDHMGSDDTVVNNARVSFSKEASNYTYEQNSKLIRYLARHNHWSPFAGTSIQLRMSAPVPIRTQAFKHKQGFVESEESRRYIDHRPEVYIPDEFRESAESVKQGSAGRHKDSAKWIEVYSRTADYCVNAYLEMVEEGICPEQARFISTQGAVVNWIWTGNLASYARFYNQRTDPHAQQEVQDLARMVGDILQPLFPVSWKALTT